MRKYCKVNHQDGTKQCPHCEAVKPLGEFPVRKSGQVYAYCKECNASRTRKWSSENRERKYKANREWAENNPERNATLMRRAHYKRRYGVSYDGVLSALEKQSFRCAICSKELSEDTLVVDHCHTGGSIRGILCNQCNIWLAPLEKEGFLEAALAYLESHRSGS